MGAADSRLDAPQIISNSQANTAASASTAANNTQVTRIRTIGEIRPLLESKHHSNSVGGPSSAGVTNPSGTQVQAIHSLLAKSSQFSTSQRFGGNGSNVVNNTNQRMTAALNQKPLQSHSQDRSTQLVNRGATSKPVGSQSFVAGLSSGLNTSAISTKRVETQPSSGAANNYAENTTRVPQSSLQINYISKNNTSQGTSNAANKTTSTGLTRSETNPVSQRQQQRGSQPGKAGSSQPPALSSTGNATQLLNHTHTLDDTKSAGLVEIGPNSVKMTNQTKTLNLTKASFMRPGGGSKDQINTGGQSKSAGNTNTHVTRERESSCPVPTVGVVSLQSVEKKLAKFKRQLQRG